MSLSHWRPGYCLQKTGHGLVLLVRSQLHYFQRKTIQGNCCFCQKQNSLQAACFLIQISITEISNNPPGKQLHLTADMHYSRYFLLNHISCQLCAVLTSSQQKKLQYDFVQGKCVMAGVINSRTVAHTVATISLQALQIRAE